jgi:hypothetical protein
MSQSFLFPFGDVLEKKFAYDMKFHSLCFHAVLDFTQCAPLVYSKTHSMHLFIYREKP